MIFQNSKPRHKRFFRDRRGFSPEPGRRHPKQANRASRFPRRIQKPEQRRPIIFKIRKADICGKYMAAGNHQIPLPRPVGLARTDCDFCSLPYGSLRIGR